MEACLIVTYRCNARCYMCNTWKYPTKVENEFTPEFVKKIPGNLKFINITGGEPFLRKDLEAIVDVALTKTERLVISTNGYFTEKVLKLANRFENRVGFRISIEGLPAANDELRGIKDGFDRGLRTLLELSALGIRDIGFGMTVSDRNAKDMIELFRLADSMNIEFATATIHNSFYFHTTENSYLDTSLVAKEFEKIAIELLRTKKIKNWFRAYFNMGLANKVRGNKRPLKCEVGTDVFFLDPTGNIMPCNGSTDPMIMGNLKEHSFDEIWKSEKAKKVRTQVTNCTKECWMIGSASPAMKKKILVPVTWIIKNKLKLMLKKDSDIYLEPVR